MITYIDHVTLAVRDLNAAIARFRELSFFVVERPAQPGSPYRSAVMPLIQGYVELVSLDRSVPAALPPREARYLRALTNSIATRNSIFAYALHASEIEKDVRALRSRGSTLTAPDAVSESDPQSMLVSHPSSTDESSQVLPFLVQHRKAQRKGASELAQPFGIRSVQEVTVVVVDLELVASIFRSTLGLDVARRLPGRMQLHAGNSRINLIASRSMPLGTPIGLYSVGLGTTDLPSGGAALRVRDIARSEDPYTWAVATAIDPHAMAECRVSFVQL
jgi:catechol 2,3-dioxygenase-like lactoylglutathione lyase family enzyme